MRRAHVWAVVDQGSSSTKGGLVSEAGEITSSTRVPVKRTVSGDSVRQEPSELAGSVETVLDRLLGKAATGSIAGIGLTCQRSTCLLWDRASGEALTEALSWQDRSQSHRARRLSRHAERIRRRTGLPLSPHYAALKLNYLLRSRRGGLTDANKGEVVAGTLDSFLVRRLVDRDLTEPGHAGRTLCFHLNRGVWDSELCRLFGVPENALPEIVPSGGARGTYRDIPLVAVAGDQQAALLGHGGWQPGTTAAHFGTGAFVLSSTGSSPISDRSVLSAALATTARVRRYQAEGSVNSAGAAVDWACALTGQKLGSWKTRVLEPDELPWVLPTFAGAATPWWQPGASGVIAQLGLETTGTDLLGGVLFGVAMRVLDCVEALARAGVATRVLRVSGKLTRLDGLVGALADAGQIPVEVSRQEEMGLLGIARLAIAGSTGRSKLLSTGPELRKRREPRWPAAKARRMRRRWRRFAKQALAAGSQS
ncbi:MAG: FGGY family carbohydrate kinase [Thermoanaerobaculia bacterium]